MYFNRALVCAALLACGGSYAADTTAISKDEFERIIAAPFKVTNIKSGLVVQIHLKADGYATASQGYNDVGPWRRQGDAGYCIRWNKRRLDDRCVNFVKHDGKLAVTEPNGEVAWWLENVQ